MTVVVLKHFSSASTVQQNSLSLSTVMHRSCNYHTPTGGRSERSDISWGKISSKRLRKDSVGNVPFKADS